MTRLPSVCMITLATAWPFVPEAHSACPAALYSTRLPSVCSTSRYWPLGEKRDSPGVKLAPGFKKNVFAARLLVALMTILPALLTVPSCAPEPRLRYTPWLPAWTFSTPLSVRLALKGWVEVPTPPVASSVRLLDVVVADELCVMLGAVIVVSPRGLATFPARMTGWSEVMLTAAWAGPEKSMPMGLSALTESVRVSSASVAK